MSKKTAKTKQDTKEVTSNEPEVKEETQRNSKIVSFSQLPPFPQEGIVGMYPIASACKAQVAQHLLNFQRRLQEEFEEPRVESHLVEYQTQDSVEEEIKKVSIEMELLEKDLDEMKHELAVNAIKKKYHQHDESCPCFQLK